MNNINTQSMLRMGTLIHGGVYRIENYLASGGFGNTYVVRNVEFDEVYALKEFYIKGVCQRDEDSTSISVSNAENTQCFTQQREKFKKEARRIRSLNNEHIVKVHDLFEENGTAYYVMDLVDGESLASRLKRTNKPLTEAEVNNLLPQILDGLQAIHAMGIWHLDIKPANIMVDKRGVVKLIDFGASKQQSSAGGATMSTGISYTNGYAPSEQMAQEYEEFGPWTDFYALGATFYKLLTMQNPPSVTKVSDDETEDKHIAIPMPNISAKMKHLVVWMMQDKRKRRPQSAAEIMRQLSETTRASGEETTTLNEQNNNFDDTVTKPTHNEATTINAKTTEDATVIIDQQPTKAKRYKQEKLTFTVNGVSFDMIKVEAGTFIMGATSEMENPCSDETAHQVTLTKDFYIGKTEVTQALWKAVMATEVRPSFFERLFGAETTIIDNNPSEYKGDNKPVENVSWKYCQTFISKLNEMIGKNFRLPTEAEWEFAARGGNYFRRYQYSGSNNLGDVAWYEGNSEDQTYDVATKQPNELGIYDMSGNVWELCQDWHSRYSCSPQTDPKGPESGTYRVTRGGSWSDYAVRCRSSYRNTVDLGDDPDEMIGFYDTGFRLCLSE